MKFLSRSQTVPYNQTMQVIYLLDTEGKVLGIGACTSGEKSMLYRCPQGFSLNDLHFFTEVTLGEAEALVPGIGDLSVNALQERTVLAL